jgi:hypothetical protein
MMRLTLASIAACLGSTLALAQDGATTLQQGAPGALSQPGEAGQPGKQGVVIDMPGVRKLTIGGQYRLRYENRYNYDFDSDATFDDDFFAQRFRLNLGFEFNDQLSAFAQFQDARSWGEETNLLGSNTVPVTNSRSSPGFDMHQVYVDVKDFPGIGGEARIGRQELVYGAERLVGRLDWANQGRSFDGFRQRWAAAEQYRIDAFFTQIRETPLVRDTYEDAWFMGAYGTLLAEEGEYDAYLLYRYDDETFGGGVENRATFGLRGRQRLGRLEVEGEAVTQAGEIDGADIPIGETYALHAHARLDLGDELPPWIQVDLDVASGDDPDTVDNERFDPLYPTGHGILGIMDFAFWANILHLQATFGIRPSERTDLQVQGHWFQAMEETDAFFGPAGTLSTGGVGIDEDMGYEIDLIYSVKFDTEPVRTSLQIGYGIFLPGQGVEDSRGGDDPAHFGYVQGNLLF